MAKRKRIHAKRGISHEELRSDRFLETSGRLLIYIRDRKEYFILGLVGLIVLVSVGNRFLGGGSRSHSRAEFQLTMAHQYLMTGDYENAVIQYTALNEEFGGTKQGKQALYWLGEAKFASGLHGEAIEAYLNFLSTSSSDHLVAPAALRSLAACYESLGDYENAALTYRRIHEEYPPGRLTALSVLRSGICYEKTGDYVGAETMYRRVTEEYEDSGFAADAGLRLSLLTGMMQAQELKNAGE
jgi:TolA-binding protein